jgi:asparaginyl-tRNA synthetase
MENSKLNQFLSHVTNDHTISILKIQDVLIKELQRFAHQEEFLQIMPLLMSPITDPLNHDVYPANIQYEEKNLKLTASMIFHKQLALIPQQLNKILIMAPNIRLELARKKSSANHLLEFSQFDIEVKNATMDDIMSFVEDLYIYLFSQIEKQCEFELNYLGRVLPKLTKPFLKYSTEGIPLNEIDAFCDAKSEEAMQPFFVTSFKREFYDKEDSNKLGTYRNFDIIYPDGFGEGLSGAEREYQYDDITRRMKELNMDTAPYQNYLEVAKLGLLPRTAGCGIGIQRLLKFICGKPQIKDVCLFDRSIISDFVF